VSVSTPVMVHPLPTILAVPVLSHVPPVLPPMLLRRSPGIAVIPVLVSTDILDHRASTFIPLFPFPAIFPPVIIIP